MVDVRALALQPEIGQHEESPEQLHQSRSPAEELDIDLWSKWNKSFF